MDDFSRAIWIFVIKSRQEILQNFQLSVLLSKLSLTPLSKLFVVTILKNILQ
jgi:hypothetical protein